ncbi:MAG: FRG domain-containing protein [Candidatus Thiodiazotropha endolucinida]
MARTKRWTLGKVKHGMWEVKLSSWKWLHDYVHQQMLDYEHYIWRGQRNDNWLLEPSFERATRGKSINKKEELLNGHLKSFKYAVRGRRGENPPHIEYENEWWSLGQHHSLATPLLDWTSSPFVGLYFAFHKNAQPQTRYRALFAINPDSVEHIFKQKLSEMEELDEDWFSYKCEFVRPLADDNPRLVNQGGLFSRFPIGIDIEEWMKLHFEEMYRYGVLLKILIPNTGRNECLKTLNRMNINHSTLFPDIYGSSEFCNTKLRINRY